MTDTSLQHHIRTTLLYYDIFAYPLTREEIFTFLPVNSITLDDISDRVDEAVRERLCFEFEGYISVDQNVRRLVERRRHMERYARRHWPIARVMTHIIKRIPFVRGVIITGTLSKNLSDAHLDIDYFIITAPHRLWIARTLLIAFKTIFLLNSKKYFCLNYFISEAALEIPEKNIFTATEIAHAKVLYNDRLFDAFQEANQWVRSYFPNWSTQHLHSVPANNRPSILSRILELPFRNSFGDHLDTWLMHKWKEIWRRRYPELPDEKRDQLFRVTKNESKAHGPDFQTRILDAYRNRLSAPHPEHLPRLEEVRV